MCSGNEQFAWVQKRGCRSGEIEGGTGWLRAKPFSFVFPLRGRCPTWIQLSIVAPGSIFFHRRAFRFFHVRTGVGLPTVNSESDSHFFKGGGNIYVQLL